MMSLVDFKTSKHLLLQSTLWSCSMCLGLLEKANYGDEQLPMPLGRKTIKVYFTVEKLL